MHGTVNAFNALHHLRYCLDADRINCLMCFALLRTEGPQLFVFDTDPNPMLLYMYRDPIFLFIDLDLKLLDPNPKLFCTVLSPNRSHLRSPGIDS